MYVFTYLFISLTHSLTHSYFLFSLYLLSGFSCLNAATLKVSIIAQEESATLQDIQGAGMDDDGTHALLSNNFPSKFLLLSAVIDISFIRNNVLNLRFLLSVS